MKTTVRFSIVMPVILKDRINTLALKGMVTKNFWIVRTLTRESKSKNQS